MNCVYKNGIENVTDFRYHFGHKAELPPSKKYLLMRQPLIILNINLVIIPPSRFRQISRLIHIEAFLDGSVVGDELEDDGDRGIR